MLFALTIDWMNVGGIAAIALAAFAPTVYEKVKRFIPTAVNVNPPVSPPGPPSPVSPPVVPGDGAQVDTCCLAANALVAELLKAKKYDLASAATDLAKQIGSGKVNTDAKIKMTELTDPGEDVDQI